jgi:cathepsin L
MGCNGGSMDLALDYTKTHPLMLEADYPYKGKKLFKRCTYDSTKGKSHNSGRKDVSANSVSALTAAIGKGPTSVAIEADKRVFQLYNGGVLNSIECGH